MNITNRPKKQSKPSLAVLLAGVTGFTLGGLAVSQNWLPFDELRPLKTFIMGTSLLEPTPRNALFAAFSPKAEVVMIGDSITSAGEWSEIFPNVKIANRGISGETAEDILHRMDTIFAVQPKKAFIMVGINDIYDGQSVDQIFKNYVAIVEQLQSRNIRVYIQSTIECSIDHCGNRIYEVRALNEKLQSYATAHDLIFINLNERLATQTQGLLPDYTYDGMHLSAQGFVQWKSALEPYID